MEGEGDWKTKEQIGSGNFADVFQGTDPQGNKCILKIMKSNVSTEDFEAEEMIMRNIRDILIQPHPGERKHNSIIEMKGTWRGSQNVIAVEHLAGMELLGLSGTRLGEDDIRAIFKPVLESILALHEIKILHLDISMQNLRFRHGKLNPREDELVILDFGKSLEKSFGQERVRIFHGTAGYSAPELSQSPPRVTPLADVFSLGVCLYLMLNIRDEQRFPYGTIVGGDGNSVPKAVSLQSNLLPFESYVSEPARELVTRMLSLDPSTRISLLEVLNDSWFRIPASMLPTALSGGGDVQPMVRTLSSGQFNATLKSQSPRLSKCVGTLKSCVDAKMSSALEQLYSFLRDLPVVRQRALEKMSTTPTPGGVPLLPASLESLPNCVTSQEFVEMVKATSLPFQSLFSEQAFLNAVMGQKKKVLDYREILLIFLVSGLFSTRALEEFASKISVTPAQFANYVFDTSAAACPRSISWDSLFAAYKANFSRRDENADAAGCGGAAGGGETGRTFSVHSDQYSSCPWQCGRFLGSGDYGAVHVGVPRDPLAAGYPGKTCALKIMNMGNTTAAAFHRELRISMKIRSEIAKKRDGTRLTGLPEVYDGWSVAPNHHVLAMELLRGESLFESLEKICNHNCAMYAKKLPDRKIFNEDYLKEVLRPVFEGLHALHRAKILHLDIKLDNLKFRDTECTQLVLLDVGRSWELDWGADFTPLMPNRAYAAPELYDPWPMGSHVFTPAADVFSLGAVLFGLLNHFNFCDGPASRNYFTHEIPPFARYGTEEAKDLVRRMLARNPADRISLQEALQHQWFHVKFTSETSEPTMLFSAPVRVLPSPPPPPLGGWLGAGEGAGRLPTPFEGEGAGEGTPPSLPERQTSAVGPLPRIVSLDEGKSAAATLRVSPAVRALRERCRAYTIQVLQDLVADMRRRTVDSSKEIVSISSSIFVDLMHAAQLPSLANEEVFKKCDQDNNGAIDYREIMLLLTLLRTFKREDIVGEFCFPLLNARSGDGGGGGNQGGMTRDQLAAALGRMVLVEDAVVLDMQVEEDSLDRLFALISQGEQVIRKEQFIAWAEKAAEGGGGGTDQTTAVAHAYLAGDSACSRVLSSTV